MVDDWDVSDRLIARSGIPRSALIHRMPDFSLFKLMLNLVDQSSTDFILLIICIVPSATKVISSAKARGFRFSLAKLCKRESM